MLRCFKFLVAHSYITGISHLNRLNIFVYFIDKPFDVWNNNEAEINLTSAVCMWFIHPSKLRTTTKHRSSDYTWGATCVDIKLEAPPGFAQILKLFSLESFCRLQILLLFACSRRGEHKIFRRSYYKLIFCLKL